MRNYFRFLVYLLALLSFSLAKAGSYEDFFDAIRQDHAGKVMHLLQRGFDPNTPDPKGQNGLFLAVKDGSLKSAEVLIGWHKTRVEWRSPKDESPLMIAALRGHTQIVRMLIARDADVNKTGWTPLHYAATGGHVDIIRILLEEHAYIDAESPNRSTPLMMAAKYGSTEAVKLLLEEGADPRLRNQLGLNAVDFAQQGNRPEAAELIGAAIRKAPPIGKW
jgi:ankyrin repeat protein